MAALSWNYDNKRIVIISMSKDIHSPNLDKI